MSTEFKREERYLVFKLSDVEEHFTSGERQQLARLAEVQRVGRSESGKPLLECVVVEADWPEYGPTWKAIETRVTGARSVPEESAIQAAARVMNIELIRERDALRAKVAEMGQQEPVGVLHVGSYYGEELQDWEFEANQCACDKLNEAYVRNPMSLPLYTLPGTKGEEK